MRLVRAILRLQGLALLTFSTTFNDVRVAQLNLDGTLGAWTATMALPSPRFEHASVAPT